MSISFPMFISLEKESVTVCRTTFKQISYKCDFVRQIIGIKIIVWHIFPVLCKRRDELQRYLREHNVETQIHYPIPPHRQRCYAEWNHLSLPITEQISVQELSLPCNSVMTNEEANDIVALLNSF